MQFDLAQEGILDAYSIHFMDYAKARGLYEMLRKRRKDEMEKMKGMGL